MFTCGEPSLDKLLGGIKEGTMIVILGHPGAGKTTFVAKLMYENMKSLVVRCLYVSFAETKEKFYENMSRLGMDFRTMESKGLFYFVQMPTVASEEIVEELVKIITEYIEEKNVRIVVVDSITPILKVLGSQKARATLHSTLYSLTHMYNALLILIADLPWGQETVDLGGIEFVADAVLVFKTRTERGLLSRWIEVRKFRGVRTPLAEIPFAIVEGIGLKVFPMLPPEEIPPLSLEKVYYTGCKIIDEAWGGIPRGATVSIVIPPIINIPSTLWLLIAATIIRNNLRAAFISFELPSNAILDALTKTADIFGLKSSRLVENVSMLVSYNPTSHSMLELAGHIISHVERTTPDIVIMYGVDVLADLYDKRSFVHLLYNLTQYFRKMGITTIRVMRGAIKSTLLRNRMLVAFSDIIHNVVVERRRNEVRIKHVIWKSIPRYLTRMPIHEKPITIYDSDVTRMCFSDKGMC